MLTHRKSTLFILKQTRWKWRLLLCIIMRWIMLWASLWWASPWWPMDSQWWLCSQVWCTCNLACKVMTQTWWCNLAWWCSLVCKAITRKWWWVCNQECSLECSQAWQLATWIWLVKVLQLELPQLSRVVYLRFLKKSLIWINWPNISGPRLAQLQDTNSSQKFWLQETIKIFNPKRIMKVN